MNFDNICRFCLTANEGERFTNILYENDEPTILFVNLESLNIVLTKEEYLPNTVCNECLQILNGFISFKKEITRNEDILKQIYENLQENEELDTGAFKIEPYEDDYIINEHDTGFECKDDDEFQYCSQEVSEAQTSVSHNNVKVEDNIPQSVMKEEVFSSIEEIVIIADKKVDENETINCVVCNKNFSKLLEYDMHLFQHILIENKQYGMKMFCQYCGEIFFEGNVRKMHIEENHSADLFICSYCNNLYDNELDLLQHEKDEMHYSTKNIQEINCIFCETNSKHFNDFESFLQHCKKHIQKDIRCRLCNKQYVSIKSFQHHQATHDKYHKHMCKFCSRLFANNANMRKHMKTAHSTQIPQICHICGKSVATKSGLIKHLDKHDPQLRNLICSICGYSTFYNSDMAKHDRIHTNERPYKCNFVDCGNAFKTQSSLNDHKRRHLNIKKQCEICSATFSSAYSLRLHTTIHTGEKNHVCVICGKRFSRKWYLRVHMKGFHKLTDYVNDEQICKNVDSS